ncbi:patatin-like phospholipase family protein [Aquiflexum sp. TKW24L]|uniref:patatin-like phospholipase family protein n=1 Tax=Aquiflexum sp. TKW24L TaxID=2942212 RepID=UPI0020BED300|nr:patatin-like phospholipase family protein [Aquiflexum sp. TKW24L]MCL6257460.1 patatin-like phospholipase family protein [Aquiflexum sp. TKW24L]
MANWGPLENRYGNKSPRKMLALDGGGIRGIITLEYLAKIEQDLKHKLGKDDRFRLCDYFDYIAGTSTGAIIAAGLSLGMSVSELLNFYVKEGKKMFDKNFILKRWKAFYGDGEILEKLKETFGEDTDLCLKDGKYKSLLMIVTMNRTTDSPWPISNNPFAKYNDESRQDCNCRIKLFQLVRASAAAPVYFPPETLQWDPNNPDKTFVFVDGGTTPYNNPSFLLYKMATQPGFRLNWEIGEDKLLLVSVGTGSSPTQGEYGNLLNTLQALPDNLMYAASVDQDINCRVIGRCTYGAAIDRELGDMIPRDNNGHIIPLSQDLKKHFLYVRYNVELTQSGMRDIGINDLDPEPLRQLDAVKNIKELKKVGSFAANKHVDLAHFGSFV